LVTNNVLWSSPNSNTEAAITPYETVYHTQNKSLQLKFGGHYILYLTFSSGCFLKIFLRSCCCFYKLNISIIFHGNGTLNEVYFTELVVFIFIYLTVFVIITILYCVLFSGSYHSSLPVSFLITTNMADSTHKLHPPCYKQAAVVCDHQQSVFSNSKNTTGILWHLAYNTYVKCQS